MPRAEGSEAPSKPRPSKYRLAVLLADLDRITSGRRAKFFGGNRLDLRQAVDADGKPAVAFSCDLLEAALICDLLRSDDRAAGDRATAVFLNKGRGWVKLGANELLTSVIAGQVALNPDIFSDAPVILVAPEVESFL